MAALLLLFFIVAALVVGAIVVLAQRSNAKALEDEREPKPGEKPPTRPTRA
jgi:hypothetical protein